MYQGQSIGEILCERELISREQLAEGLQIQARSSKPLGRILVDLDYVSEEQMILALGLQKGLPMVDVLKRPIAQEVLDRVPEDVAKMYKLIPLSIHQDVLDVAVADAMDVQLVDDLRFVLGCEVNVQIADPQQIDKALSKYYGSAYSEESVEDYSQKIDQMLLAEEEDLEQLANEVPVIKLVRMILSQAVRDSASDIHFEPFEDHFKVRYRVDGMLFEMRSLPANLSVAISSRIKVMAGMDIAETRLPQDGRIDFSFGSKRVDLRVSSLPTVYGEGLVLRVLDKSMVSLGIEEIGLDPEDLEHLHKLLKLPNGIVLATGPTGSGKTTTLYSLVKELNDEERKIITTEDPIEYDLDGVTQVAVRPKIGLDFAKCLRHILRQDPDVIMVGEIRDSETVRMSVQAALTGHLVFSTIHTNDAASTVTRLLDMGIEPFLMTASLNAVVAQRLVRKVCTFCAFEIRPEKRLLKEAGLDAQSIEGKTFLAGKGCERCGNSGFKGRTGIFELLVMTEPIKRLILARASNAEIRKQAIDQGMLTMREDGFRKVFQGVTTLEEVIKETQGYV